MGDAAPFKGPWGYCYLLSFTHRKPGLWRIDRSAVPCFRSSTICYTCLIDTAYIYLVSGDAANRERNANRTLFTGGTLSVPAIFLARKRTPNENPCATERIQTQPIIFFIPRCIIIYNLYTQCLLILGSAVLWGYISCIGPSSFKVEAISLRKRKKLGNLVYRTEFCANICRTTRRITN